MSIFDDDQPDLSSPRQQRRTGRQSAPTRDESLNPEERREPSIASMDHFEDDEQEQDTPSERHNRRGQGSHFEPIDANRNRHLSSSLNTIRDDGPAYRPQPETGAQTTSAEQRPTTTPQQKPPAVDRGSLADREPSANREPSAKREPPAHRTPATGASLHKEPARNPFASDPAKPSARPAPKAAAPQPEQARPKSQPTETQPAPTRQPPPPPPVFARGEVKQSNSLLTLILWTLVSVTVVLSAWNMMRLSSIDAQLSSLSAKLDGAEPEPDNNLEVRLETRLARVENNLQPLESHIQDLQKQLSDNGQNTKLAQLENRITQLQRELKAVADKAAAKPATPKATASAPAATAPQGWVINIASLANRKNAETLRDKARALGADTRVESYPSRGRTLYRIRAFGYRTQSAAEKEAQRLQTALNISGMLVRKAE